MVLLVNESYAVASMPCCAVLWRAAGSHQTVARTLGTSAQWHWHMLPQVLPTSVQPISKAWWPFHTLFTNPSVAPSAATHSSVVADLCYYPPLPPLAFPYPLAPPLPRFLGLRSCHPPITLPQDVREAAPPAPAAAVGAAEYPILGT